MFAHSHTHHRPLDYGFQGSKFIHRLGLAGVFLVAVAAYTLWGAGLGTSWLIVLGVIGLHLGVVLLIGAGALTWISRVGRFVLRDRMLGRVPWRGDEHVLDVGCGAGPVLIGAAKRLTSGRAVGIDQWTDDHGQTFTADTVRANAAAEGVADRIDVRSGDACDMEFPDAAFDVVFCSFVLHHIDGSGREAALREMVRVLKPGGRLVLVDALHTSEIVDTLTAAGATEVRRESVVPLVSGLRWVTARKPAVAA